MVYLADMEEFFGRLAVRVLAVVIVLGILLGLAAALRTPPPRALVPEEGNPVGTADERPVFASFFTHFFPGRTHDGTRPTNRRLLLRASRFLIGERVGIRAQTAPDVTRAFVIEVRFLTPHTREELPNLRDDRQRFRIRSGLRTYCCLRMPKEPGDYVMAVLVGDEFLSFYPVTVKEPSFQLEGGLLTRPEDE